MIYAFTGKTGSGKTFNMVRHAFKYWLAGVDIYSNTILSFQKYDRRTIFERIKKSHRRGRIIYFEDISEILEAKNGLILFDEAQVLFNARNWEALPAEFQYKLQQHRKHRLDLFCTTQNMGTIDISYRRLVQKWFHHEPIIQLGNVLIGWFRVKEKDIDFLYNSVDDLAVPDLKARIMWIHRWKKRLYDTYYDIGFKRFKIINECFLNEKMKKIHRFWILPKAMSLSDGRKQMLLFKSEFGQTKSPNSRTTWKNYATNT